MAVATLTAKGQVVIPVDIRTRHKLTPGTQIEFVDEAGVIRFLVRRRPQVCDPAAGYGMVRVPPVAAGGTPRRLSSFDSALLLKRPKAG